MNRKEKSDEKITTDKICYLSFSLKWFICFHLAWPELIWMFFFLNKKQKLPLNTTSNSNVMPNKVLKVVYCELLVCKVEETNLPTADNWCRVEKAVREPGCPFSSCYKCMLTFADNGRIWVSNVDLMSRLGGKKLQKKTPERVNSLPTPFTGASWDSLLSQETKIFCTCTRPLPQASIKWFKFWAETEIHQFCHCEFQCFSGSKGCVLVSGVRYSAFSSGEI